MRSGKRRPREEGGARRAKDAKVTSRVGEPEFKFGYGGIKKWNLSGKGEERVRQAEMGVQIVKSRTLWGKG